MSSEEFSWVDRTVLITGAGGFIGSHLSEALAAKGARVTALLKYNSTSNLGNLKNRGSNLSLVTGDISDPDSVRSLMEGHEFVFHLAAVISVPYSFLHPREVFDVNAMGTLNVLQAARATCPSRVVVVSSSEVYGTAQTVPIAETHPLVAQSPYAASKIAAEKLAESFFRSFGVRTTIVRPFNTYGPRQSLRAVIPAIITQALRNPKALKLGTVGTTRDFNYVSDTVAGMIHLCETAGALGGTYNLGTGIETQISDVVKLIAQLLNLPLTIALDEKKIRPVDSEVLRLCCDNNRVRNTGWIPRIEIKEGLALTIKHYKEFSGGDSLRAFI